MPSTWMDGTNRRMFKNRSASHGYLYFTANQLHRQPGFHGGRDLRRKPYELLRIKVGAAPVLLRSR